MSAGGGAENTTGTAASTAASGRVPPSEADATARRQLRSAQADYRQLQQQMGELRKQYTQERREWQTQAEQLRGEVAQLQLRGGYKDALAAGGSLAELPLDAPTLEKITGEIREQETLISAFQKENERLTEELRSARDETRAALAACEAREEDIRRLQLRASQAEVRRGDGATEELQRHLERARTEAQQAAEAAQLREVEMRRGASTPLLPCLARSPIATRPRA